MPNYDDRLQEPTVLPARIPELLVNGSSGIAVGMATNIPPHNLKEVIDGIIKVIDNPETTIEELMEMLRKEFKQSKNVWKKRFEEELEEKKKMQEESRKELEEIRRKRELEKAKK